MKKYLLLIFVLMLNCISFAEINSQNVQNKIQKYVKDTLLNKRNQNLTLEPLLLTADIVEWGISYPSANQILPPEKIYVFGPNYQIPEEYSFYVNHHFNYTYHFIYRASPTEIENKLSKKHTISEKDPISGWEGPVTIQAFDSNKLIENRKLLESYITFDGTQRSRDFNAHIGCKVYALSNNWLITASTCPLIEGEKDPIQARLMQEGFDGGRQRKVKKIYINKNVITDPVFVQNNHILLVYVPSIKVNEPVLTRLQQSPKLNILAYKSGTNSISGTFYLNLHKNAKATPLQVEGSAQKLIGSHKAAATDPFFMINNNTQYLAGYNAAAETYHLDSGTLNDVLSTDYTRQKTNQYYSIVTEDLQFIYDTVQQYNQAAWPSIAPHLYLDALWQPFHPAK